MHNPFNSLRFKLFMLTTLLVLASLVVMGGLQQQSEVNLLKQQIIEKNMISLRPIENLAGQAVDGANLLKLKSDDAKALFLVNEDLIAARINGTSAGSEKTLFSDAIPPQPITYIYINEKSGLGTTEALSPFAAWTEVGIQLDEINNLLLVRQRLEIKNGGVVEAVFRTRDLKVIWLEVTRRILLVGGILLGIGILFSFLFGDRIARPIRKAIRVIKFMEAGDFTHRINIRRKDEIGDMTKAVDMLAMDFANVLGETRTACISTVETSEGITETARANVDSLEHLSSAVKNISEQSQENAEKAYQITNLVEEVHGHADQGNQHVRDMVNAMEKIDSSAKEVTKIIKLIDEIAFQTNLLALNAAVEAARAGDSGKGFAVVAEEVRNLATRSAEAAKRTATLVDVSNQNVDIGVNLAERTAGSLGNIVEGFSEVSNLLEGISASTIDQKEKIGEVTRLIGDLSETATKNNIFASGLRENSQSLFKLLEHYKTGSATIGGLISNSAF